MKPSISLVQMWFGYDNDAGILVRKLKSNSRLSDIILPSCDKRVYLLGKRYPYSHIVWVVCKGKWPDDMIDHKDHDQMNMKIDNLREATQNQNQHNKRGWGQYGKGVYYDDSAIRSKPWLVRISVNSRSIFIGTFANYEDAKAAHRKAVDLYHGEFACHE